MRGLPGALRQRREIMERATAAGRLDIASWFGGRSAEALAMPEPVLVARNRER